MIVTASGRFEPEDPRPRDALHHRSAERRPERDRRSRGGGKDAKRARALARLPERLDPPAPQSAEEKELLGRFVEAFLADDVDGMVALVTEHAWFRMPPANREYQGRTQVQAILTALFNFRAGQPSRLLGTRANGQPAYGVYRIDPASRLARPTGLLLLSLTGRRIAADLVHLPGAARGIRAAERPLSTVSETL